MVGDQTGQVPVFAAAGPDGLLDGVDDEACGHRGGHRPPEDPSGVGVDHDGGVAPARPRRDIGEVGNPETVRRQRCEVAVYRSAGLGVFGSLIVVLLTFPRAAPRRPNSLMSRSTVHRAIGGASAGRS